MEPARAVALQTGSPSLSSVGGVFSAEVAPSPCAALIGDRYEVLALLGTGAMGCVYKVRDAELDEVVALKMLRPELLDSAEALERFRREVRLARRVTHRNVARTFDIGRHEGGRFLTMELVEGMPLSDLMRAAWRTGPMPVTRVAELASSVCEGLAAAHDAGVVHRDLKPENVLVGRDAGGAERVVLTDFGVARGSHEDPTRTIGTSVGTPSYMAPEQVQGQATEPRTDLFALGVMLFEMLTGTLPYRGDSVFAVAVARLLGAPPDPRSLRGDLPSQVAELVLACLARSPSDRPAHAREVAARLSAASVALGTASLDARATLAEGATLAGAALVPPAWEASRAGGALRPAQREKTVSVLPFASQAQGDAPLAEGLAQDVADTLSTTKGLRLRAATGQAARDGSDPRAAGTQLGVDVVVSGSLRRVGDLVRVTARAVSVADGFQLWAGRFDRGPGDLLVVSDEVAREVARALVLDVDSAPRAQLTDPEAVELYLRARHALSRSSGLPALDEALGMLRKARERTPDDPGIESALAIAYVRKWFSGDQEVGRLAKGTAERAVELAPHRAEPLLARAYVAYHHGAFPEAIRDLLRAVELAPNLQDAHHLLGSIQLEVGPIEPAASRLRLAVFLDPWVVRTSIELARSHALLGQFDEAHAVFASLDKAGNEGPVWVPRARIAMWEQSRERAESVLQRATEAGDQVGVLLLRAWLDRDRSLAERFLRDTPFGALNRGAPRGQSLWSQASAEVCALFGEHDAALSHVERADSLGLADLVWLDRCPLIAPIRGADRFRAVRDHVFERILPVRQALGGG
jgi:TolB-like protein/tRNA A-37 threonylcarbamoyl transferase component Bud32/Flp pilus assembly protein TadD